MRNWRISSGLQQNSNKALGTQRAHVYSSPGSRSRILPTANGGVSFTKLACWPRAAIPHSPSPGAGPWGSPNPKIHHPSRTLEIALLPGPVPLHAGLKCRLGFWLETTTATTATENPCSFFLSRYICQKIWGEVAKITQKITKKYAGTRQWDYSYAA